MASLAPRPSWRKEFLIFFGSLKLAIGLLLAIAAASTVGTVLPQDEGPGVIMNAQFLIIGGGIVGGLTGLKNSTPVQVGQTISSAAVVDTSYLKGKLHIDPRPFDLRLDAFRMDFRPNGQVKQYYSEVTVTPKDGVP